MPKKIKLKIGKQTIKIPRKLAAKLLWVLDEALDDTRQPSITTQDVPPLNFDEAKAATVGTLNAFARIGVDIVADPTCPPGAVLFGGAIHEFGHPDAVRKYVEDQRDAQK
jgi:hypothetical protein